MVELSPADLELLETIHAASLHGGLGVAFLAVKHERLIASGLVDVHETRDRIALKTTRAGVELLRTRGAA